MTKGDRDGEEEKAQVLVKRKRRKMGFVRVPFLILFVVLETE